MVNGACFISSRYGNAVRLSGFAVVLLAGWAHAQVGATISSSLDQTAGITSKGKVTPSGSFGGPIALPEDFSRLLLAPGFRIEMSVFGAPEMDQTLQVDNSGNVTVPLVGPVYVANGTLLAAEKKITDALVDKELLVNPQVSLIITAFTQPPVLVAGEVQLPGKIQILAPQPLLDLIASAGGVTTAAGGDIEIDHPQPGGLDAVVHIQYANGKEPTVARQTLVYPGDTVFVRRAGVIYVLGAVNRPGGYLMVNGGNLTVAQAVALAYGTSPIGSTSTVTVIRKHGDTVEQVRVPLTKEEKGEQAQLPLQDGDMVYVPTSKLKAALINSSTVLSSAASATIYAAAAHY
jgi:polysaccharide export outer membrane protein